MRPLRLVLLLTCFIILPFFVTFLSLLSSHPRTRAVEAANSNSKSGRLRALFSFHTPSSLWPPSAIISLTDDNSTFFLARPAAFGPLLPSKGLSGQLWVGSGFGDDTLRKGDPASGPEGELGCSDVPGWEEGGRKHGGRQDTSRSPMRKGVVTTESKPDQATGGNQRRSEGNLDVEKNLKKSPSDNEPIPNREDGTDDHLHHPLPGSDLSTPSKPGQPADNDPVTPKGKRPTHADIQSLQESAEIAGKIVLLSRGGCGFLEKVKWVQRRGGVALIVGDDTRGGGLVTMYARGDTSNVTIPSLFTSHTTAHLLSSLVPPDEIVEDKSSDDGTKQSKDGSGVPKNGRKAKKIQASTTPKRIEEVQVSSDDKSRSSFRIKRKRGWFKSLLSRFVPGGSRESSEVTDDSRRPPSSGNIDWVLVKDFNEDDSAQGSKNDASSPASSKQKSGQMDAKKPDSKDSSPDGFVIGVQDWRDPDLVSTSDEDNQGAAHSKSGPAQDPKDSSKSDQSIKPSNPESPNGDDNLKGGSITPGSGEYVNPDDSSGSSSSQHTEQSSDSGSSFSSDTSPGDSWLSRLKWGDGNNVDEVTDTKSNGSPPPPAEPGSKLTQSDKVDKEEEDEHEGLWVTLTPTSMSSSPFFDTLLVLVVSPLITLTVVYALLLLRSRIRRRRWRAPKSVVDRLPVRTYHTMSCSSTASSSQVPSPAPSSPSSPLLRSTPRSISSRSRLRSQTTSGVVPKSQSTSGPQSKTSPPEKGASGPHSWRKKYHGKQVECVVCLEEYVDGQSRVMSLPCGHEFHAECITPWLTTRRRTCPICKGDVVRSMGMTSSSPSSLSRRDSDSSPFDTSDTEEDVQDRAARTRNESPSSTIPIIPTSRIPEEDLEQGRDHEGEAGEEEESTPLIRQARQVRQRQRQGQQSAERGDQRPSWRNLASFSLSALSGEAAWRQAQADRSR